MRQLAPLPALFAVLTSMLMGACNDSPVANTTVATPPSATATKPTAADSLAALKAAPAAQPVPFVGKPGLKAVLRSGGLAPISTSTR